MTGRELAWRVIARELTSTTEEQRGTGERAASYVITPLGARANRVLIAGELGPAEMVGRDESAPFYRSRLVDPTGEVPITAGAFHPRALNTLREVDSSRPSVVVGKAHLYRGRDGNAYASVRAEAIRLLSGDELWAYMAESLDHVARRFDLATRLRSESPPADSMLSADGFPVDWVEGSRLAKDRYPSFDVTGFRTGLDNYADVVEQRRSLRGGSTDEATSHPLTITRDRTPTPPSPPTASERAQEAALLDLVDELGTAALDGYADLKDIVDRARAQGLDERTTEELVGRLEESGALEEPIVGKLRRA